MKIRIKADPARLDERHVREALETSLRNAVGGLELAEGTWVRVEAFSPSHAQINVPFLADLVSELLALYHVVPERYIDRLSVERLQGDPHITVRIKEICHG